LEETKRRLVELPGRRGNCLWENQDRAEAKAAQAQLEEWIKTIQIWDTRSLVKV